MKKLSYDEVEKELAEFEIGFRHPFGKHGKEDSQQILERKPTEIQNVGFTYWSFRNREKSLKLWENELEKFKDKRVVALCTTTEGEYQEKKTLNFNEYWNLEKNKWDAIPIGIKVPHPNNEKRACAFKVKKILEVEDKNQVHELGVEWLRVHDSKKSSSFKGWDSSKLCTKGEVLVKKSQIPQPSNLKLSAILELEWPYVVRIRYNEQASSEKARFFNPLF